MACRVPGRVHLDGTWGLSPFVSIGTSCPPKVSATHQLFLDARIERFRFRQDKLGVVFHMQAGAADAAKTELDKSPLTTAGLTSFEFIPVGPPMPLGGG